MSNITLESLPRVNAELLAANINKNVVLCGSVDAAGRADGKLTLTAAVRRAAAARPPLARALLNALLPAISPPRAPQDKQPVVVHINGCDVPASKFVEVHGLVKADKSVAAVRPFSARLPACARAPCPCPRPRT